MGLRSAQLSQSSLHSGWSVNSSWSQSSRLSPREEFWVSLGGQSPKPKGPRPHTVGRPSSAGGRPPLPPRLDSKISRRISQEDRPGTADDPVDGPADGPADRPLSVRASPKREGRKHRRRSTQRDGGSKDWATPPLTDVVVSKTPCLGSVSTMTTWKHQKDQRVEELVPREVRSKVLELAGSGALVIEMLWSNSQYLPAHNGGQKYKEIASTLMELMEGRLSRGLPLPVLTIEKPVHNKEKSAKCAKIYDRYSEWERSFGLVASNSSYYYAPPSRMGAFEVHLVQGTWDPQLCASGPLPKDQVHRGPPVIGSLGILCSACAARHDGSPSVSMGMSQQQREEYQRQMKQQHSLLHSKLWTRRWPGLRFLLGRIGAILIQPVPDVARPVSLRRVSFQQRSCPHLTRFSLNFERKAVPLPPDPVQAIGQELRALDCPAQMGWFITTGEGDEILCRCGGGSHTLEKAEVLQILGNQGFDTAAFSVFCHEQKMQWSRKGVNEFIAHFFQQGEEMQGILEQMREDHVREVSRRKAAEETAYQQLCKQRPEYFSEQDKICKEYVKAFQENERFRLEEDIQSFEERMRQAYPNPEFYQGRINALKETFQRQLDDYHGTVM